MREPKMILALAAALMLAGAGAPPEPQTPESQAQEPRTKTDAGGTDEAVTGRAAIERMIGNTLVVTWEGDPEAMLIHLLPDGAGRGRKPPAGEPAVDIRWSVAQDGSLCVRERDKAGDIEEDDCARISLTGDRGEIAIPGASRAVPARLMKGNPYKL